MGLTLTQAVSRVASRLNKNANDTTVFNRIKNHINDACQEKWNSFAWSFRYREYPLVLSPKVTTGTMTATNASNVITASGTPFIAGTHEGAWIQFTGDTVEAWYKIRTVSSTSSAVIEPAYQGTSGSGKVYELSVSDYLLPTELVDTGSLTISHGRGTITPEHQLMTDRGDFPSTTTGSPTRCSIHRSSRQKDTYSTGTLSGTINTNTLTGSSTAWLANVKEGDAILIGSTDTNYYTVASVDSDTQITLYQSLAATASGASYVISRKFGKVLRVWPIPDRAYTLFIKGLRAYYQLINNSDTNEFLCRWPSAVIEAAIWREASSSPDPREDSLYQKSEMMWAQAQSEDEAMLPKSNYTPIWNPRQRR